MTLKITIGAGDDSRPVVRLEGRLCAGDLAVFERVLAETASVPIGLDLSELRWIDPVAIERLVRLIDAGARVVASSPFVEKLMAHAADSRRAPESATHATGSRSP